MRRIVILFPIFIFIQSCTSTGPPKQSFDYIPFEEYKYTEAGIQPHTEVELLAFSGGEEGDEKNLYYYQFIVFDKASGDTLRILTPLISVDEVTGENNKTYTTPLQYDPEKRITRAYYDKVDSSHNLVLQFDKLLEDGKADGSTDISSIMNKMDKKQFVVVNKSMPEFVNPKYRTSIGILNFKEKPW